jgi:drug/metabolite transporter (DMT)-like permease
LATAEALSQILTCAMLYLIPLNYSIVIVMTYPIMHTLCGYFLINKRLRLYEVVSIFAVILGIISLFQLDYAKIIAFIDQTRGLSIVERAQ